ncbi:MAG TPA: AAA family ATPase, partial [Phnomibacter sp.]|nr:AAA family ATPase [Phnomibacter sp.]
ALYLEWFKSVTFKQAFQKKQEDILDFLYIAIAAAKALGDIHQHNIIHKDVSPYNILVNLQERTVKIIDFGISTRYDIKHHYLGNPERLEGTLAYNSPEQTGRMNRTVDHRSDLYSLGVTFYEALAGRLPFESSDAMELVHAHIAHIPPPLEKLNSRVPAVLARIIEKLMAKNAEDRYQSAFGLQYDLEKCLAEFERNGQCSPFGLAQRDHSGRLLIAQKLYGREKELEELMQAYQRCAAGARELMLVSGYSGTGKSALVREVHKPITGNRGFFIEGKYDQFQRAVPYFAILKAFGELTDLLLTENEDVLAGIKADILGALGEEAKVITDVLPQMEHIIGPQPPVPELGGAEAQNRFNYLFRKLVNALATEKHPLVLFIDDLQWADSSSLSLLRVLMTDPDSHHLLCIGAYRDNEVSASHPFIITLGEMEKAHTAIARISIGNLSPDHVNELIADATDRPTQTCRPLTQLVYQKTSGNAFFVIQFLKSLFQDGLLWFDFETLEWNWDLERITQKNITDNVVELMASKVQRLPPITQQYLKTGACIGSSFDLSILSIIEKEEEALLKKELYDALAEG